MGEYSYHKIEHRMNNKHKLKSIIHIMNSKFHYSELYDLYDKNLSYRFCSGFLEDEIKTELALFPKYQHHYFPLSIKVENKEIIWKFSNNEIKKIGIFTRLTQTKPLDPFLNAFVLLLNKQPNIELHLFGNGDPEKEGINQFIRENNLINKIKLRGHQENMKQTAINENLNLVWFHSYYGVPGGFAGFEICSLGIPQLFWNFTKDHLVNTISAFPIYDNLNEFVNHSFEIINDKENAEMLSQEQFDALKQTRDINKFIGSLETLYSEIAKS